MDIKVAQALLIPVALLSIGLTNEVTGQTSVGASVAQSQVESEAVKQFRLRVMTNTAKFRRYPQEAKDAALEGRAIVRIGVSGDGQFAFRLRKSSGHEVLDTAALDMVSRAAPTAEIPAVLRGKEFAFEFQVDFQLRSE